MELPASAAAALRAVLRTGYLAPLGCKHLANANKLAHIRNVNASMGMETSLLVTPFELLEHEA